MSVKKYDLDELRHCRDSWKEPDTEDLSEEELSFYQSRKKAVDLYIDGVRTVDIQKETGIARQQLPLLIEKCTQYNSSGQQFGYTALQHYFHVGYKSRDNTFQALLKEIPGLGELLWGSWTGDPKYISEKNITYKDLHNIFLKAVAAHRKGDTSDYPFNTKNQAFVSMCGYIRKREKDAAAGNGQKQIDTADKEIKTLKPFSDFYVEGQLLKCVYSVESEQEDGTLQLHSVSGAAMVVVLDAATRCILGYSIAPEAGFSETGILKAIKYSVMPHEKIKFRRNAFTYPENGGFPSSAFPKLSFVFPERITFDHTKLHLPETAAIKIARDLKCRPEFGPLNIPEIQIITERFYGILDNKAFRRPSTDYIVRSDDRKSSVPAAGGLRNELTFQDIREILEISIAEYNNTPHSGIDHLSPMECLKRRIFKEGASLSQVSAPLQEKADSLDWITAKRIVRGRNNGKRLYVAYGGIEYRGRVLTQNRHLIGKTITLHVNPSDLSFVQAYDSSGTYLGDLSAPVKSSDKPVVQQPEKTDAKQLIPEEKIVQFKETQRKIREIEKKFGRNLTPEELCLIFIEDDD